MNTELRKKAKNDFEKHFFKLMNNSVLGKTMENAWKHRDIKLVTTDKGRNRLVSEPNCHTTKWFSENLLAIEMKKIKVKMNKPVLEISKTLMHEFWYRYMKPKLGLMKDELGGKIMTEFDTLRPKTYSYIMDDGNSDKKAKGTKKCVIK